MKNKIKKITSSNILIYFVLLVLIYSLLILNFTFGTNTFLQIISLLSAFLLIGVFIYAHINKNVWRFKRGIKKSDTLQELKNFKDNKIYPPIDSKKLNPKQIEDILKYYQEKKTKLSKKEIKPNEIQKIKKHNKFQKSKLTQKQKDTDILYKDETKKISDVGEAKTKIKSDLVHFTITSPSEVEQQSTFIVNLWAHLDKQREEVLKRACEFVDKNKIRVQSVGPERITKGTILLVELQIDELSIKNPINTIRWEREIASTNFDVSVPNGVPNGEKAASVKIYTEGCLISILNFTLKISDVTNEVKSQQFTIKQYHRAFCSYASVDRNLVIPRIQMVKKVVPGMEIFLDVISLRSGEKWEEKLWEVIPKHDIFYLFWSQNTRKSKWVEKEWQCALETKGIDLIDPVPLSREIVPPPPELAEKHFYNGILKYMSK